MTTLNIAQSCPERHGRRKRIALALLGGLVAAIVGALAIAGHNTIVQANDSARHSCLAAIHAEASRRGKFSAAQGQDTWRVWTHAEVHQLITSLPKEQLDCYRLEANLEEPGGLRVRTRATRSGDVEAEFWFADRPSVTASW